MQRAASAPAGQPWVLGGDTHEELRRADDEANHECFMDYDSSRPTSLASQRGSQQYGKSFQDVSPWELDPDASYELSCRLSRRTGDSFSPFLSLPPANMHRAMWR